jgi:hypothetical protein
MVGLYKHARILLHDGEWHSVTELHVRTTGFVCLFYSDGGHRKRLQGPIAGLYAVIGEKEGP